MELVDFLQKVANVITATNRYGDKATAALIEICLCEACEKADEEQNNDVWDLIVDFKLLLIMNGIYHPILSLLNISTIHTEKRVPILSEDKTSYFIGNWFEEEFIIDLNEIHLN